MDQPLNRKSIADVADTSDDVEEEVPTSPEKVLELDESSFNGLRSYKGKFKYKVPTMGDRVDIAALKSQYLQQLTGVDRQGDNIAEALAYLNVTIDAKECPDWWKDSKFGIGLYDFTPLLSLYAKARAYEATFLGGRPEPATDESKDGEGRADPADGDVDGDVQDSPVGRKVLASFGKGSGRTAHDVAGSGEPESRSDSQGDQGESD